MPDQNVSSSDNQPLIQSNVNLKSMNTLGVEAHAKTFIEICEPEQLSSLFDDGFFDGQSPVILGGGSNLLFRDEPDQPIVKISVKGREIEECERGTIQLNAGAGENWHQLVTFAVKKGLGGFENLALIPGTVGAAPIQNIGAYGVELKDVFKSLTAFDIRTGEFKSYSASDCNFGYRDSIFKRDLKGRVIVCGVTFQLEKEKTHELNLSYSGLENFFEARNINDPTIKDVYNAVVDIRQSKLPDPSDIGNAGSFFKNPVVTEAIYKKLASDYPNVPYYEVGDNEYKIPAGWLIETAGWKGKRVGNVGTYKNQALVIVNHGGATGEEIYRHALTIQKSVRDTFDIDLRPEVNIVGNQT